MEKSETHPAHLLTAIKYWTAKFNRDRISIFNEERPGRPTMVVASEIIKTQDVVINDRKI